MAKRPKKTDIGEWCFDFETPTEKLYNETGDASPVLIIGKQLGVDEWKNYVNIDHLFDWLDDKKGTIYFHNLSFDGLALIYWVVKQEQLFKKDAINDQGIIFTLKWKMITFKCSLNYIGRSNSIEALGELFGFPKGDYDYDKAQRYATVADIPDDIYEYCKRDVLIAEKALLSFREVFKVDKLTIASVASHSFISGIGEGIFYQLYKFKFKDKTDDLWRRSYSGGLTAIAYDVVNRLVKGKIYHYDVVSLYPSVMKYHYLPYGRPLAKRPQGHSMGFVKFTFSQCRLRHHRMIPHLKDIDTSSRGVINYISNYNDKLQTQVMTEAEYDEVLKSYYGDFKKVKTYYFRCNSQLRDYVIKWEKIKNESKKGTPMYYGAKLMLNSLYGKFAENPVRMAKKIIYDNWNRKGGVCFDRVEETKNKFMDNSYLPLSMAITSLARVELINAIRDNIDNWLYCDTDSIILKGKPKGLSIGEAFGDWSNEIPPGKHIDKFKAIRAKCYVYQVDDRLTIKVSGLKKAQQKTIGWNNFIKGNVFHKLVKSNVRGGVILVETPFTL